MAADKSKNDSATETHGRLPILRPHEKMLAKRNDTNELVSCNRNFDQFTSVDGSTPGQHMKKAKKHELILEKAERYARSGKFSDWLAMTRSSGS